MAASPFETGSIIYVKQFRHNQLLPVEVVSSASIDYGATARIYRGIARLPHYSYDVALKVIPHVMSEVKEELLRRELNAISQLSMRRILPFIGTASVQLHTIIVAEYMEHGNLLQYLKQRPAADRQQLLIQVAEAVHWLHACKNLVHGDLKCENVLVNKSHDAVLADFGLATLVDPEASSITTVTAIRQMNTLRFAAPELILDPDDDKDEPVGNAAHRRSKTCQSDVYALGMLILQAFAGRRPWDPLSDSMLLLKLATYAVHPRPSDHVTMLGLTDSWWAICLRCWEREPQERPTMQWVWETLEEKRRKPRSLISNLMRLSCVAVMHCGKRIVTGSYDGAVVLWDSTTGETVGGRPDGHGTEAVYHVAVSPNGRHICSCGADNTIRSWDTESGAPIGEPMTGHDADVNSVAFSPDGTRIVSCSDDHTVRLWDATTGVALGGPLVGHDDMVWFVAFSPDGACIASTSWDGTTRLWDGATGADSGVLRHPGTKARSLCFSPDRTHLVCGCDDGSVQIWNVSTRQLVCNIEAHSDLLRSVAVSPSGRYIASGSDDEMICIWDAHTGDAVGAPLTGHTNGILSVAFSPNGRSLVSVSEDGTVRILDLFE